MADKFDDVVETEPDKAQSRQSAASSGDLCSADSGNMVSLLRSGKQSEGNKAPEETDGFGVAAASSNKANTNSANVSRDLSMPWVKELPVHLLAAYFQRMPPPLKRQVEMTTHQMAEIMKVHGWRKWNKIDILIPDDPNGSFRVNDSFDVDRRNVVSCVQLLLSRIRIRLQCFRLCAAHFKPHQTLVDVSKALLGALIKSKDDGVAIRGLELYVPPQLLEPSTVGEAITTFSDTLIFIVAPKLDESGIGTIGKCDRLETLVFARVDGDVDYCGPCAEMMLKDALDAKSSLKNLVLIAPSINPLNILVAGVHQLKRLSMVSLQFLEMDEKPTADQANLVSKLMSNLECLEIDHFHLSQMDILLSVLRAAPQLKRLHITGPGHTGLVSVADGDASPDDLCSVVKGLADECFQQRRSLYFFAWFTLPKMAENVDGEAAASNDDRGMLASMMKFDKEFVTSPILRRYGVTAFDKRLHAFDAKLKPTTTKRPSQIVTIGGSRIYKRVFTIVLRSDVHLTIAFGESPEMKKCEHDLEHESDEEADEPCDHDEEDVARVEFDYDLPHPLVSVFLWIAVFVYWIVYSV